MLVLKVLLIDNSCAVHIELLYKYIRYIDLFNKSQLLQKYFVSYLATNSLKYLLVLKRVAFCKI